MTLGEVQLFGLTCLLLFGHTKFKKINELPHDFGWPPPFLCFALLAFFSTTSSAQPRFSEMHASEPGRNSRRTLDLGEPLHPTLQCHDLIGTGNANTLPVAFHDPLSQRVARSLHDEMQERGRPEVNKSDSTKRNAAFSDGSFHPPHRTKKRKAPIVRIAMLRTKMTYLHLLTEGCRGSIS